MSISYWKQSVFLCRVPPSFRPTRPWHVPEKGGVGSRGDLIRGVGRHFEDDAWFHSTAAFRDVVNVLADRIRTVTPPGTRASFYAHVLTEILLDAHVAGERPEAGEAFERSLTALDPEQVAREAAVFAPGGVAGLAALIGRFRGARVLEAYADDVVVAERLTALGRRVRQPPFSAPDIVAWARPVIRAGAPGLLEGRIEA